MAVKQPWGSPWFMDGPFGQMGIAPYSIRAVFERVESGGQSALGAEEY